MATVVPPVDQTADLVQKMSLESQKKKTSEVIPEATKKTTTPYVAVNAGETNGHFQPYDGSYMDPNACYYPNGYPYYYGAYDGTVTGWDYLPQDGVEMPHGIYGETGAMVYHPGYGYSPYGVYNPAGSPVPAMGPDGQLYGPQHYQYPSSYYQQPTPPPSGPYASNQVTPPVEVPTPVLSDKVPTSGEAVKGNANGITKGSAVGINGSAPSKSVPDSSLKANASYGRGVLPGSLSGFQDPGFGYNARSSGPWSEGQVFPDGQPRPVTSNSLTSTVPPINGMQSGRNQNLRPLPNPMGLHTPRPTSGMGPTPGFMNNMYPNNRFYGQCGNNVRNGPGFGSNGYDSRTNGRGWYGGVDSKYRPRGRGNGYLGYGNENMDGLNELNRGPRARSIKNLKGSTPVLAVKGQVLPNDTTEGKENSVGTPNREDYNRPDFPEKYSEAKFFIIKSYSEDDVHKSIKYSVWASTPNGNKKLDAGYKDSQEKTCSCPVFLFFSVNTSGQFVGLAEMVGPVDFKNSVEYWQQDKWNGCFPVKWHIVKDIPNSLLKHITLENNENKPVTNSRDTQEVKFERGLEMIKIFKDYSSKTCILDDFAFYETRQKTMQEKRAKQQLQKQVWDSKPMTADAVAYERKTDGVDGKVSLQKSFDDSATLTKESTVEEERMQPVENGSVSALSEDTPKGVAKPVLSTEKTVSANGNGIANGF